MITRPLDLSSQLRKAPRSFDWVFFVNFGLIALFFVLFGSRFVLSPALAVDGRDLTLSTAPDTVAGNLPSTLFMSVKANGQKYVEPNGLVTMEQLKVWLAERARRTPGATMLVRADAAVRNDEMVAILTAVKEVGLFPILAVRPDAASAGPTP
jgi:biopolymer transport protein ExbD